jgi:uncharacterized tellurite resistance protein B-like protein
MTNPELCFDVFKVKGHHFGLDLSEGVWKEDDGDFGPEFYEIPEEDDGTMIFGLEEAIAVVSYVGIGVDGITPEETGKLMDLFEEYKIDPARLKSKIDYLSKLGEGLKTCYDGAVKVILAHNEAMLAFRISAEFAYADGKLTRSEQKYWDQLAVDLYIAPETAALVFDDLAEQNPQSERDWKILQKPIRWTARGEEVKRLQEALKKRGYLLPASGYACLLTRNAVISFQKKNNLPADGVVRQDTWDALFL